MLTMHSPIFRDAHSRNTNDSPKEMHFTDLELENRAVLSVFLNLLNRPVVAYDENHNVATCVSLISSLRKYDCEQVLQILQLYLARVVAARQWCGADVFGLGAILDDPVLCATAVQQEQISRRLRRDPRHFKVDDLPLEILDCVPQEYLATLANVFTQCSDSNCSCTPDSLHAISLYFEQEMSELQEGMKIAKEKRRRPPALDEHEIREMRRR